jgi:hypothetical protein
VRRALSTAAADGSAPLAHEAPPIAGSPLAAEDAAALRSRVRRLAERGGPFVGVRLSIYVARMIG